MYRERQRHRQTQTETKTERGAYKYDIYFIDDATLQHSAQLKELCIK